jgi:hypothetical protein
LTSLCKHLAIDKSKDFLYKKAICNKWIINYTKTLVGIKTHQDKP